MDDAEFQRLLQPPTPASEPVGPPTPRQPEAAAGTAAESAAQGAPSPPVRRATPQAEPRKARQEDAASLEDLSKPGRDALGKPSDFLDAAVAGAGRAVLETKDFILGEPTQKSETRQAFDKSAKAADEGGTLNPVVSTISQFATGMLGAGKLLAAARMVPAVNAAVGTAEAVKGGAYAVQSARAATVGAVAFDPHQERLSNLLEQVPILGPPMFGWLAAREDDPAWEGRAKAALESIGLDAVLGATFLAGAKLLKAMRGGSPEAVEQATKQLDEAARAADDMAARAPSAEPQGARTAQEAAGATTLPARAEGASDDALRGPMAPSSAKAPNAYHGSPRTDLSVVKAGEVEARQFDNATSQFGAFFSPDAAGAQRYAGEGGKVYGVTLTLKKPYEMPWRDFNYFQSPNRSARDADGFAHGIPPEQWGARAEELRGEAAALRAKLEAEGHDGIIVRRPNGQVAEVASFRDVPLGSEGGIPRVKPAVTVTPEEAETIVAGIRSDLDAIDRAGSLQGAVDEGHVFGRGANIPWNKLNLPGEVDDFVARVADSIEGQVNKVKGGAVLEDARVNRQINGLASYFNIDPATIVGRLQASGQAASRMVADMEAAYLIANRMHTEAFNLASRISLGDFAQYGSREAAMAEFQRQVTLAGSMFASGQSMRAAMGRGMRRLRSDFAIDPDLMARVHAMDGEKLLHLFTQTAGDPKKLKKITNKSWLTKALDEAGFFVQNNLLWSPVTHAVNFVSNSYMLAARPVERTIGAVAQAGYRAAHGDLSGAGESLRLPREALVQLSYYPSAFLDGFSSVVQALKASDSVMDPRHAQFVLEARGQAVRDGAFRAPDSLANVLHDAYLLIATPTRLLTTADEMMKQVVYRSHVASKAWAEGVDTGLAGRDLRQYIKDKVSGAFDDAGRATDKASIQEARISTFSQDLLPGTMGKTLRGAVANHPVLRFILPFTQTPTNIFRYTVKMSPGFNLMQDEYRQMISGKMGAEAQAQALGQMAVGALTLGAIANSSLNLTGGGPSDPKIRAELMATGWRPYSIVWEREDGTKAYLPIGRIDPLAVPFGIVADIMDYMHATGEGQDSSKVQAAISTLGYSIVKQVANKTYLLGLSHVMEAFTDPDRNLHKFAASLGSEFVPASSALRFFNPDPYMREVRTFVDGMMANVPGLSEGLNPRRDAFGEPVRARNVFLSTSPADRVTAEMQRMEMLGWSLVPPSPSIHHADLRDITMKDGRNAWDVYQELAGKPTAHSLTLREQVSKVMDTAAYRKAPDGHLDTPGTKLYLLHAPVVAYRRAAGQLILKDENVRTAVYAAQKKVTDAYKSVEAPRPAPTERSAIEALRGVAQAFGMAP